MQYDQAFTSPLLLLILLSAGIYAVGTAQRKFKGYPGYRFDEKGVLVEPGDMHFLHSENGAITACEWNDKNIVHFLSTYHGDQEHLPYEQKNKGLREIVELQQPTIRKFYNENITTVLILSIRRNLRP